MVSSTMQTSSIVLANRNRTHLADMLTVDRYMSLSNCRSNVLAWVLYRLPLHQSVQERLYRELAAVMDSKGPSMIEGVA